MLTEAMTVGELIAILARYPSDTKLAIDGPDIGGYDVTIQPMAVVSTVDEIYSKGHEDYYFFNEQKVVFIGGAGIPRNDSQYDADWWDIKSGRATWHR